MSRVFVSRGELVQSCTTHDGIEYSIAFPLVCVDGSPAIGDYRGEGEIVDRNGAKVLVLALGCAVHEYAIGGLIFGMRQKRRTAPKGKSDVFMDG